MHYTKAKYEEEQVWLGPKPTHCSQCGDGLFQGERNTGGFVYWHCGTNGDIAMHQVCAEFVAMNLIQDARTLSAKTGLRVRLRPESEVTDTAEAAK